MDNGVMVGWSLGGDLVLQASDQLPDVKGYFIFGTAPFGIAPELPPAFLSADESYAGAAVNYGFSADLSDNQIDDFVNAFFRPGYQDIPEYMYDDGRRTDPMTRATLLKAATGQDPSLQDEIAIVRSMTTPIAMLLGDQDALVRPEFMQALAPQMPTLYRSKTIIVKNSGHAIHWERPKAFIAHLRRFIRALH
ncbi:MAG: alpha/beta hydrolase [Pseudomonadales bacterium]|nr:alpha/beta hydrolase [Pseudomonadales bacterium]